eukprot:COSAG01_NODE_3313_length_6277_cov_6.940758_4_plen_196_part_00
MVRAQARIRRGRAGRAGRSFPAGCWHRKCHSKLLDIQILFCEGPGAGETAGKIYSHQARSIGPSEFSSPAPPKSEPTIRIYTFYQYRASTAGERTDGAQDSGALLPPARGMTGRGLTGPGTGAAQHHRQPGGFAATAIVHAPQTQAIPLVAKTEPKAVPVPRTPDIAIAAIAIAATCRGGASHTAPGGGCIGHTV